MSAVAVRAPPDAAMGWAAKGDRDGLAALLKSRGYNIHGFHPSCLAVVRHRIQQRLAVLGYAAAGGCEAAGGGEAAAGAEAAPVAAYAAIAAGDEARELDAMLRINYTQWNRNHIFDFLHAQVFRRVAGVARDNGDAVCRAWCAGCSTGQEPFALVGYWDRWARTEQGGAATSQRDLKVDATDLDEDALNVARGASYRIEVAAPGDSRTSLESFGDLPEDLRSALVDVARGPRTNRSES